MLTDTLSATNPMPNDPILGLNELYKQDSRPQKVNLGVGIYLDAQGQLPLLKTVETAERRLVDRKTTHGYIPMSGMPDYLAAVQRLAFGSEILESYQGRIASCQTLGGTGGLHIGGLLAHEVFGVKQALVPNPTWGNHVAIMKRAGMIVDTYPYYCFETKCLDFEHMLENLKRLAPQTLLVMHACCHNPTGLDLSEEQWTRILEVIEERDLLPFLDMAYQGFGSGLSDDANVVRRFVKAELPVMVAQSNSKNFSLYGERVGALTRDCSDGRVCAKHRLAARLVSAFGILQCTVPRCTRRDRNLEYARTLYELDPRSGRHA